jgi:23S rRNA (cytidine2498-2'-O)-methyltransferase
MLHTCQAGFEALLARELRELRGATVAETGPGWVKSSGMFQAESETYEPRGRKCGEAAELAFAHVTLLDPVEVRGESVNSLAQGIAEFFLASLRGERIEAAWPNVWLAAGEASGLGRRMSAVADAFGELLKKKLSRVAKLARDERPREAGAARGLFVFFADFGRVFAAREAWNHGPRRMADDPLAPSRSYLKVEEAYRVLGREPAAGETVCDLGAAPGGWSYSAAKRGARVLAIDNGPLKAGAAANPQIEHRREDAFKFTPASAGAAAGGPGAGERFDWLFCDLVEEPHHVLRSIVEPWLAGGWCRRFVVNLKFGRVDPIALLRELEAEGSAFSRHALDLRSVHLYHDREEFTVVGVTASG